MPGHNPEISPMLQIKQAVRQQKKFRAAVCGPSGSGKTYTSLALATGLANGGRILVIDSEDSSSSLYADEFSFEVLELPNTDINTYIEAIDLADKNGFDVVVIDSASHAWESVMENVDAHVKRNRGGNSFQAWGDVGTPLYRKLLARILQSNAHVICTIRSKTDYVMEEYTDSQGRKKTKPVKVGLAPVFRQGGEYEFDVVANVDLDHNLVVEKSRLSFLADKSFHKAGKELGTKIKEWLDGGAPVPAPIAPHAAAPALDLHQGGVRAAVSQREPGQEHWDHVIESPRSNYRGSTLLVIPDKFYALLAAKPEKLEIFTPADRTAIQAVIAELAEAKAQQA